MDRIISHQEADEVYTLQKKAGIFFEEDVDLSLGLTPGTYRMMMALRYTSEETITKIKKFLDQNKLEPRDQVEVTDHPGAPTYTYSFVQFLDAHEAELAYLDYSTATTQRPTSLLRRKKPLIPLLG